MILIMLGTVTPPVTLDIVAANERASAAANPPYKLAQLDIIDHT
jgi:hypothetical protein